MYTLFLGHSVAPQPITKLFKRMLDQFDRLRKRNAFMDVYKKEKLFENGLEEFDDAR
jgi:tubulin gamma